MINVSIQGSCVIRDAIAFCDKDSLVNVDRFVRFISPMTLFGGKPIMKENVFELNKMRGHNFSKRCMQLDFEKKVFDYLAEVNSDFILLDISSLVMYFYAWKNGVRFTDATIARDNKEVLLNALGITKENLEAHRRGIFDISVNDIRENMHLYAQKILEIYKPSQIIVVELYMAEKYIDPETGLPVQWWQSMLPTHSQNSILKIAYETLIYELGGVHMISFPEETYGKVDHRWGKYQLHYTDEYYMYLWNELLRIMQS